jgi:hypothetical protein
MRLTGNSLGLYQPASVLFHAAVFSLTSQPEFAPTLRVVDSTLSVFSVDRFTVSDSRRWAEKNDLLGLFFLWVGIVSLGTDVDTVTHQSILWTAKSITYRKNVVMIPVWVSKVKKSKHRHKKI